MRSLVKASGSGVAAMAVVAVVAAVVGAAAVVVVVVVVVVVGPRARFAGGGSVVVVRLDEESFGVSRKLGRGAAFVAAHIRPYVSSSTMTLDILLR